MVSAGKRKPDWRRKRVVCLVLISMLLVSLAGPVSAQGIARSHGAGFRIGFWKMNQSNAFINVSRSNVEVSGVGPWFYFFSRLADDWMVEFNLGTIANVVAENIDGPSEFAREDVTVIIPFLFGMRYDFLSAKNPGTMQPYLSFGMGPHWVTEVDDNIPNASVQSGSVFGGYLGGGFNIALTDWFALNCDVKYHAIDFDTRHNLSGFNFGLGVNFMWGKKREMIQVREIRMVVTDIYPAYYQFYNYYPLAIVRVQNMTKGPVEVSIKGTVRPYSERPRDTGYIKIPARESKDIPIHAIFGPRIRSVSSRESAILDLQIEARAGGTFKQSFSNPIMVHNRNSWNGEMDKLVFFVTPDDERILALSRKFMNEMVDEPDAELRPFHIARTFFAKLSELDLRYQNDPLIPFYRDDRVQYAFETLELKTGDCDDLVVLYASLLESTGINTAFVEVQNPNKEQAHLFLIFNTTLPPERGFRISSNRKRYMVRENSVGQETIWIPAETTMLAEGFEASWQSGALQILQEGILDGGLADGWVRVIDVD